MNLLIERFPDEVRWKLRAKAYETGVTLRQLVIHVLSEWSLSDGDGVQVEGQEGRGKVRAVGEKIKGQMERISGKLKEAAADEMEF